MNSSIMPTYSRLPVTFVRGEGAWLWDNEGNRYLDALSGIGVCNLGHAHPELSQVLCQQAGKLWHTSNLYNIPPQEQLGRALCQLSGMDNAFFCNSGAEANEAAIKIARAYGTRRNIAEPRIVVAENSFHGRTLATLSATGNPKIQQGFEPLVPGFVRVPFADIEALEDLSECDDIVAVMLEPIQGEGGIRIPAAGFLSQLRSLCDRNGWLMILDEVQTGIGRTGHWFAHQRESITPDVMTLAKALGNGFPIGACVAKGKAAHLLDAGMHGSTFGGNFLGCRVALEVIRIIEEHDLIARTASLGQTLHTAFERQLARNPQLREIRSQGLMLGLELQSPCYELVPEALKRGLLINVTSTNVVRLLPPLILEDRQAEQLVTTLVNLISGMTS